MSRALDNYLTSGQVKAELGCCYETARQLALRGAVRVVETPLGRLYDADDVRRLAAARKGR